MLFTNFRQLALVAVLGFALGLTACSGGGNDDSGPSASSGTLGGSGVKGIIKNALVVVSEVDPETGESRELATGVTDDAGRYDVDYEGYSGGLVYVEIKARPAGDPAGPSTTVCDRTDGGDCGLGVMLGDEIELPADFTLTLCLDAPPSAGGRAPVTPFTDVIARRAQDRSDDAALEENLRSGLLAAAYEINQILGGLDAQSLEAIDLTNPQDVEDATPEQLVYSSLIAALLSNAVEGGSSGSDAVRAAVEEILNRTGAGSISTDDWSDLVADAQAQLLGLGLDDETGTLDRIEDTIGQIEGGGGDTFDPERPANIPVEGVGIAKNLFNELGQICQGEVLDDLSDPGNTFVDQVDVAAGLLEDEVRSVLETFGFVIENSVQFNQQNPGPLGSPVSGDLISEASGGEEKTATVTITDNGENRTVTAVGDVHDETVNLSVTFPRDFNNATSQALVATAAGSVRTVGSAGAELDVSDTEITVSKSAAEALQESLRNVTGIDLVASAQLEQFGIESPLTVVGELDLEVDRCTSTACQDDEAENNEAILVPTAFGLTGDFSNPTNQVAMSFSAELNNLNAGFDPEADTATGNFPALGVMLAFDAEFNTVAPARVILDGNLDGVFDLGDDDFGPDATVSVSLLRDNLLVFKVQADSKLRDTPGGDEVGLDITLSDANSTNVLIEDVDLEQAGSIGVVKVAGVEVAEVRRLSSGLVIVAYEDGTFESVCR